MTQIVVAMVVIVLLAGVVVVYVAFPHRGEDLPGAPWLGRLMRKGARSLPTVEPEPGDVMPVDGGSPETLESPLESRPARTDTGPAPAPRLILRLILRAGCWMVAMGDWLYLIIGIAVVAIGLLAGLLASGRRRKAVPAPTHGTDVISPPRADTDVPVADDLLVAEPAAPTVEKPETAASRLVRLRQRLAGSQGGFGRGLLALLSRDRLDEDTWEAIEDTLLTADVGVAPTQELVDGLRTRLRVDGVRGRRPEVRAARRAGQARRPRHGPPAPGHRRRRAAGRRARRRRQRHRQDHDRRQARPDPGRRGQERRARRGRHLPRRRRRAARRPGASGSASRWSAAPRAATRRAWPSTRSSEGAERGVDTVIVDTAGRLQNKAGLMDELGKVKRVIEKVAPVTEVLLVLDATTARTA